MCRSCVKKYYDKYCQQCPICGHPAHIPLGCVVGSHLFYPVIIGRYEYEQRNCTCPDKESFNDPMP